MISFVCRIGVKSVMHSPGHDIHGTRFGFHGRQNHFVRKLEIGGWMFGGGEIMVKVGGRMMNLVMESDVWG